MSNILEESQGSQGMRLARTALDVALNAHRDLGYTYRINANLLPPSNGLLSLGNATQKYKDLHLNGSAYVNGDLLVNTYTTLRKTNINLTQNNNLTVTGNGYVYVKSTIGSGANGDSVAILADAPNSRVVVQALNSSLSDSILLSSELGGIQMNTLEDIVILSNGLGLTSNITVMTGQSLIENPAIIINTHHTGINICAASTLYVSGKDTFLTGRDNLHITGENVLTINANSEFTILGKESINLTSGDRINMFGENNLDVMSNVDLTIVGVNLLHMSSSVNTFVLACGHTQISGNTLAIDGTTSLSLNGGNILGLANENLILGGVVTELYGDNSLNIISNFGDLSIIASSFAYINSDNTISITSDAIKLTGFTQALSSFVYTKNSYYIEDTTSLSINESGTLIAVHTDGCSPAEIIFELPPDPSTGTHFDILVRHLESSEGIIVNTNSILKIYSVFRNRQGVSIVRDLGETSVNIVNLVRGDTMHVVYEGHNWYLSGSSRSDDIELLSYTAP